jgi:hypothetical protein
LPHLPAWLHSPLPSMPPCANNNLQADKSISHHFGR